MIPRITAAAIIERWDDCEIHTHTKNNKTYAAKVYLVRNVSGGRRARPDLLFSTPYIYRCPESAEDTLRKALEDLRERYPNPNLLRRSR